MSAADGAGVHATAVAVGGAGVLIRGASGSGKSALALALLLGGPEDTRLVADDRVRLYPVDGALRAKPVPSLAGLFEVRGQGILRLAHLPAATVALVVDLRPLADCPRLPEPADRSVTIEGVILPRLVLPAGAPDGAGRVRLALARLGLGTVRGVPTLLQCGIDP